MNPERLKKTKKLLALARKVAKLFPGYEVAGVDPGFELVRWEKHDSGRSSAVDRISFSEMAARTLLEGKEPARMLRKDL